MHFDILILDNKLENSNKIQIFLNDKIKHVNTNISDNIDDCINMLTQIDFLVINPIFDFTEILIQKSIENDFKIIFLIDENYDLKDYKYMNNYDFIYKPSIKNKLVYIIEEYINISKNSLKTNNDYTNFIIDNVKDPIFSIENSKFIYANKVFFNILDCKTVEELNLKYKSIEDLFVELHENDISYKFNISENIDNKKVCILNKNLKKEFFKLQKISISNTNIDVILLHDNSHEKEYEKKLENLLYTDSVTGLPNRANLIENLKSSNLNIKSISIIDITSFKEINDFFGNKIGDYVLKELGSEIYTLIYKKEGLKLYKFPADTYCITNETKSEEEFTQIIRDIVLYVYKRVFRFDQHKIDVRVCAGISYSNKNNKLITADIALQSAKKSNKDYLVFFDELDNLQEYENNMLWTKKLKSALSNDRIVVFFQPLVNNETMCVDKYECLVRLIDEDGKVIAPFFFLDISKKSNQYKKITRIVLEKSFKKFENLPFEFSVNISYEDISDPTFLDFIKDKIKEYNISSKLVFEILEDEGIKNYDVLISFIDEVKALGCKVAIDDFGSGYSNFEHLLKMKIDYLKIDASLIKNIAKDENSYKITKTIVEFAKNLNLETIAEYVENKEILELTKDLNITYSQGYYFSAPIVEPTLIDFKKGQYE